MKDAPSMQSHKISYRPDIDGLRGIAVVMVILFHAFPKIFPFGFVGVDIFFVISGYLISKIILSDLDKDGFSFKLFYARRIKRIFPSLSLVLLFTIPVGYFALLAIDFKQLGKEIGGGAFFISNFVLLSDGGYFDAKNYQKPLLHLWSLAIEEQFYLIWPLFLWTIYRFRSRKFIFQIFFVFLVLSFGLNILKIFNAITTFYNPLTRFWEFLIGCTLALLEKDKLYIKDRNYLLPVIGISAFILSLFITDEHYYPGYAALLPTFAAAGIIGSGFNKSNSISKAIFSFLTFGPIVLIGRMSFSLYLWHWPIFSFARIVNIEILPLNISLILIILTFIVAYCTYFLVEDPIRKLPTTKILIVWISLVITSIGFLGLVIYLLNGLPNRKINLDNIEINNAINYDAKNGFRNGVCFLDALDEDTSKFDKVCTKKLNANLPTIILWGDSHAASLYRGLLNLEHTRYNIIQLTASGCPPVLGMDIAKRPKCKDINQLVINKIIEIKPNHLILSAFWSMYTGEPSDGWEKLDLALLENTVKILKSNDVKNIILIGHLPIYKSRQADILRFQPLLSANGSNKPIRTFKNFDSKAFNYDKIIRDFSKTEGLIFISPLDALCDNNGCQITTADEKITPLSFDYGHLTEVGSTYVLKKISLTNYLN